MRSGNNGRAPRGLRATELVVDGQALVVLSHPVPRQADGLTEAERDVRRLLLDGATYAEIAAARGTSVLTIRKQVHALYARLGISGRRELAASSRSAR